MNTICISVPSELVRSMSEVFRCWVISQEQLYSCMISQCIERYMKSVAECELYFVVSLSYESTHVIIDSA